MIDPDAALGAEYRNFSVVYQPAFGIAGNSIFNLEIRSGMGTISSITSPRLRPALPPGDRQVYYGSSCATFAINT